VQVPANKEIANHVVPESCAAHREVWREALTGVRIGQPLSHESHSSRAPTRLCTRKATRLGALHASAQTVRRGRRPWHVRTLLVREPGDLQSDRRRLYQSTARIGKARSRSQ
jgi:hypothetical protein